MEHIFFSDDIDKSPLKDELGYSSLAKNIAISIHRSKQLNGFVIAINGKWGIGKSTTLGYIETYLKELSSEILQITFNPWWFSNTEELIVNLVKTIVENLDTAQQSNEVTRLQILKLKKFLWALVDTSKASPTDYGYSTSGFTLLAEHPNKNIYAETDCQMQIPKLKEEIGKILTDIKLKIVIMIDDVDRLTAKQLRDCLHAIKVVADLPNVTYIIALDKNLVAQILDSEFCDNGAEYLEKFVHVSFDLPVANSDGLRKIFDDGLETILSREEIDDFEINRFNELYHFALNKILTSPRRIVRLLNSLSITLPAVRGELNSAEFVALECVRLFKPEIYNLIKNNKEQFAGNYKKGRLNDKSFHESWQANISSSQSWLTEFLIDLFPRIQGALQQTSQTDRSKELRETEKSVLRRLLHSLFYFWGARTGAIRA